MNKTAAFEWLEKAWHHFSSGKLLYEARHYTDTIGKNLNLSYRTSYPSIDRVMPSYEEMKEVIDFGEKLFSKICKILQIDKKEIQGEKHETNWLGREKLEK